MPASHLSAVGKVLLRGILKKFPHFYIFVGNGEGGRSSNWSCL